MRLGILDIAGRIEETIELARLADAAGYTRYWIAEHQPQPTPLLVAAIVAGQTERIRVGSAGLLRHYHPPLRTAHDVHFLARVYPGRMDAGFCGGITPHGELVEEDRDGRDLAEVIARYPARAERFVHHLRNTPGAPGHAPERAWIGASDDAFAIWSLGGSPRAAEQAAALGLGYGFPLMFARSVDDPRPMQRYRERFAPHRDLAAPAGVVAVCGVCAETDAAAEAIAARWTNPHYRAFVVGGPARCRDAFAALADRYGVDEIVFTDLCGSIDERQRCYELLAP
jgi:luciferase family oxidoreductase group 1